MAKVDINVEKFAAIFSGYEQAHGEHVLDLQPDADGKIKGKASTKIGAAQPQHYINHIAGAGTSLGLIPLLQNDCCLFGAIDVDIKGDVHLTEPIEVLEKRIRKLELPLVVCRSKSGGAHLYMLFSKPTPAKIVQSKLTEFAAILGYGGAEIFPKQVMRVNEQDRGNWINICYYGSTGKAKTNRYCIRNGKPIYDLAEFLKYAEMMRMSPVEAKDVKINLLPIFQDGPPCLQHLATVGVGSGGRNCTLTNAAVYFKKSTAGDGWQDKVKEFNDQHIMPSLPSGEVSQIVSNMARKDYFYQCKNPPLNQHCDKKKCLTREFGIGTSNDKGDLFPIGSLTKCESRDSVRWYVQHAEKDGRMEVNSETLLSQVLMKRAWLDKFSEVRKGGKGYEEMISEKVEKAEIIHDPDDASPQGQFENLLSNFFSSARPARNRDELIKGNSYVEDGRIHFRSEDLFQYLSVRRFVHKPHEVWMWLKQMGAGDKQMRIKGKMIRVWHLPEPEMFEMTGIDVVDQMEVEI